MKLTTAHRVDLKHLARICVIAIGLTLFSACGLAQTTQENPNTPSDAPIKITPEEAIADLKSRMFTFTDIDTIAAAPEDQRKEGMAILETQFPTSEDPSLKARIASSLIRLGDKGDSYWNYLAAQAMQEANDDAPFYFQFDKDGHLTEKPSPEFIQWATDHHLSVPEAAGMELSLGATILLGMAKDSRAIPILRKELSSPNFIREAFAAKGLASLHDKDSVPLIIAACGRAPADIASMIAVPLVYFDDDDAKRTVDLYVPKERAAAARQERAEGIDPMEMATMH
jgi:hypothetical protein